MLKRKFGMIVLILITTIALALPVVRADNETTNNTSENQVVTDNNTQSTETTTTDETALAEESAESQNTAMSEENFKQQDIYLTGDNVTIDYIVDGNLFVFANTVTINSQIGGDAFIFANSVTVGEQGYIFSNLFTVSTDVNVQGVVYDLYALSRNVNITGYVYRDIRVTSDTLNLFGTVGRNAYVSCSNMNFSQNSDGQEDTTVLNGMINGNLEYSSQNEITIPDGTVTGEVKYNEQKTTSNVSIQSYLISLGTIVATAILIWLICSWLTPKFVKRMDIINKKSILPSIGLGIIAPIILVIVSVILLLIRITSPFGLLLLAILFILIGISTSISIISINNLICNKLKINKTIGNFGMLIVTAIVLWLIGLIPYIGGIFGIVIVILGIGIMIYNLFRREKLDTKQSDENNNKK